jgi:phenylalanyl-tRNA synthetase beta chain
MNLSSNWLRDFTPLPDDVDVLVGTLNGLGIEVAEARHVGGVPGVVTARVIRMDRHPDAAKVIRVWVDQGDGVEHHVWCGASNFAPGDVVPLATVGTTMPDGRTLGSRGILGIPSDGMLCSAHELGLGSDHSGILVLDQDAPLGVPYGDVTGLVDDVVIDVDVTRNRPDAFGHVGVARDVAAKLGLPFTPPHPTPPTTGDEMTASVEIVAGQRCGRFTLTILSGIDVGPSAPWMAARLHAVGQRPINNVVDVSNYVMLELNQPNHAYDLATLGGGGIRVRLATDGEELTTLDGMTRTLAAEELLICDAHDAPIGLAGIMGGEHTEIGDATTTVALEFAWFEPLGIAASVARTGLRSDASARWERGVDAYNIDTAIARFVELLGETCPNLVVHAGAIDARAESLPAESRSTSLRVRQAERIIGVELTRDGVAALLDPIGFTVTGDDPDALTVELPSWRPDATSEIDVIEEIARHYGYENVPKRVPLSPLHGHLSPTQQRRRLVREVLLGLGISEVMPSPFLSDEDLSRTGFDGAVLRITNPLVAAEDVLRPSLRPGLLRAVAYNESHRHPDVSLFEIGHVYPPGPGELPDEREMLGVVLAGSEAQAAIAVWRELAAALGTGARIDQQHVPAGLHPTRSAALVAGRDTIGSVGEVAPAVLDAHGISQRVAIVEVDLSIVLPGEPKPARWRATSRHPSSDLDMAFLLDETIPAEKLEKAIRQGAGNLLVGLRLFDVYRGPGVEEGVRSLAYRLRLQAADRTLTDADTAAVVAQVRAAAEKLGATLRA